MSTERMNNDFINHNEANTERFDGEIQSSDQIDPSKTVRIVSPNTIPSDDSFSVAIGKSIQLNESNYQISDLIASSGESEIFLIKNNNGKQFVLKYYFSNYRPKEEIVDKLKKLKGQSIIYPIDHGLYNKRFWEINEYMPGGTLDGIFPIQSLAVLNNLVGQINEIINVCHENKIIHRDIKPTNFFFADTAHEHIVLGDFGIASPLQDEGNYRLTLVHRTATYAAPELFTNIDKYSIIDSGVDYYALGISILEAWIGGNPFKDIAEFNIMRIKMEGKVIIPNEIPSELQSLIKGLLTTEPPKRWGYNEVKKWLNGEAVTVHYHTHKVNYQPYEFDRLNGLIAHEPVELAQLMELNPKKSEQQLYSGSIGNWVKQSSQDLFSELFDIVENEFKSTSKENVEAGVTKAIYLLDKDRPFKAFDGTLCYSPMDISFNIEKNIEYYKNDLGGTNRYAKLFIFLETRGYSDKVEKYRKYLNLFPANQALNLIVLDLQENKLLFEGNTFENIIQLISAPVATHTQLLYSIADETSKVSMWLNSNFPELSDNLNKWRTLNHLNIETLGYALKTGGIRINDENILNVSDFKFFMADNLVTFFAEGKANANRLSADYWLKNYQHTSITNILLEDDAIITKDTPTELFKNILSFILQESRNPIDITFMLYGKIALLTKNNPQYIKDITVIIVPAFENYLGEQRSRNVFALDIIEKLIPKINSFGLEEPALAKELLLGLDKMIYQFIHDDFEKLQKNSDSYFTYRQRLKEFVESHLSKIANNIPYITHWKNEEKLILHQNKIINDKIIQEFDSESKNISDKFFEYMTENHERSIDYLKKGKSLYSMVLTSFCWGMAAFVICLLILDAQQDKFEFSLFSMESAIIGLLFLVPLIISSRIKRRPPKKGLGVLFDPFYIFLGKMGYRPVLKQIANDPKHQFNLDAERKKQTEVDKLKVILEGKKTDLGFQESIRINLLKDSQLDAELNGVR